MKQRCLNIFVLYILVHGSSTINILFCKNHSPPLLLLVAMGKTCFTDAYLQVKCSISALGFHPALKGCLTISSTAKNWTIYADAFVYLKWLYFPAKPVNKKRSSAPATLWSSLTSLAGVLSGAHPKEQVTRSPCVWSPRSPSESGAACSARGSHWLGCWSLLSPWVWDLDMDSQFSALIQSLCDAGQVEWLSVKCI